jgi:hypothetical protein
MSGVEAEFVIARNPEEGSALPYLLRLPLGDGVVLKARETWPRTAKVYCHRADGWPDDPEIVERVPVRACVRRGAAIDLVLDRAREHRSQIVFTFARGREAIFWQTARTARKARPSVTPPRPAPPAAPNRSMSSSTPRRSTRTGSPACRSPSSGAGCPRATMPSNRRAG